MRIYLAGTPAGWSDHVSYEDTEYRLFKNNGLCNRLVSNFYSEHVEEVIKGLKRFNEENNSKRNI